MEKLQDFQMFTNKKKIGMLQPDTWIVHSSYRYNGDIVYRIALEGQEVFRPIAIINGEILHPAMENGVITLLGFKRISKTKNREKKK